jgi:hypothetical protein
MSGPSVGLVDGLQFAFGALAGTGPLYKRELVGGVNRGRRRR